MLLERVSKLFKRSNELVVPVLQVEGAEDLKLPEYKTIGAVGLDLHANVPVDCPVILRAGEFKVVPTGICIELPLGVEAQVRARSGNAKSFGIGLVNGIGTIDYDYRGEIGVILCNWGSSPFIIHRGDRIAQLVFNEVKRAEWLQVSKLSVTERGVKGYGSTKLSDN